jgi:diguanylate cyclase (GGDEF)-like protein
LLLHPVNALLDISQASVSGGYVVAMAAICLLQYAVHVHRMNRARREREDCHRELSGAELELESARRDRTLTRHENQIVREFLSEGDCDKALRRLVERLAPPSDDGCAFCLRYQASVASIEQSVGFGAVSPDDLEIDRVFRPRLARGEPVVLAGEMLFGSRLWATFPFGDRQKIRELYLFGIAGEGELLGVFGTTSLMPAGDEWSRQLESTARVLSFVGGSLRDRWRLDARQNELKSKDEMLFLRSIADRHFDSPLRMIGELVEQAAAKIGADRAVLFLSSRNQAPQFRPLIRCGESLPSAFKEQWYQAEDLLAAAAMTSPACVHHSAAELLRMNLEVAINAAILVPIAQEERTIGLLIFTRRRKRDFSALQRELAAWTGALLADQIPRVVNQAVVTRQARIDALTQLANRGSFDRRIAEETQSARSSNTPLSLLIFDLDRFKSVNDRYGHRAGDAVLRATAAIVREGVQNIRIADHLSGVNPFVARYGGEELAVLLPRFDLEAARRIGESICRQVAGTPIDLGGESISVTTSAGLAGLPDHADSADDRGRIAAFNMVHRSGKEGWMGPLAVRTELQGSGTGKEIVTRGIEWLKAQSAAVIGLETMPRTMDNIGFYASLGFVPGALTVTLTLDAALGDRPPLQLSRVSDYERDGVVAACRDLTQRVIPGYDFTRELELTDRLSLGDTLLIGTAEAPTGFAVCHTAPLVEGRSRDELRVLKLVLAERSSLPMLVGHLCDYARRSGTRRVAIRMQGEYTDAWRTLVALGARVRWTDLRMSVHGWQEHIPAQGMVLSNWEI